MNASKIKVVVPFGFARQDKVFRPGECVFAETLQK
jgi:phosphoribosylpyrophosphate synthetase